MSNQVATTNQETGIAKLKATLQAPSVQEQFKNALAEHKDLFVSSIIDLYNGDKSLQKCNPNAIICEALKAAVLRLPINKALGFAYIVVYNNSVKGEDGKWYKVPTPTFIPGYKGYIQLAMRTGMYKTLNADFVYKGELKKTNKLTGAIDFSGEKESDEIIGYFCYFELLNGFNKTLYIPLNEMASYAKRYSPSIPKDTTVEQLIQIAKKNEVSKSVGWMGNFNDMALKTVIRRLLSKYGYLSVEMQGVVAGDSEGGDFADRNEMISQGANKTAINLDSTTYEEVDTETGEIKQIDKGADDKGDDGKSNGNSPDF